MDGQILQKKSNFANKEINKQKGATTKGLKPPTRTQESCFS